MRAQAGPAYEFQTQPAEPGGAISEVVVDGEGVEFVWRDFFGFTASVAGGADTDGDGMTDAIEAACWTDPRTADAAPADPAGRHARRAAALASRAGTVFYIDGQPSTQAEVMEREELINEWTIAEMQERDAAASARVAAWTARTGNAPVDADGVPYADVEGDKPIAPLSLGSVSNANANIFSLWPMHPDFAGSGILGTNVTGAAIPGLAAEKVCGLWEKFAPLAHSELTGRLFWKDTAPMPQPDNHATSVAGIIGAAGLSGRLDYRGAALGAQIWAYDAELNTTEIASLSSAVVKDMPVSNHSYAGGPAGWVAPDPDEGIRIWNGDIGLAAAAVGATSGEMEDFAFGVYNEGARVMDIALAAKPYHLMVAGAGNERGENHRGDLMSIATDVEPSDPHMGLGTDWFRAYLNEVLVYVRPDAEIIDGIRYGWFLNPDEVDLIIPNKSTTADNDNDGIPNGSDGDIDGDNIPNGEDWTPWGALSGIALASPHKMANFITIPYDGGWFGGYDTISPKHNGCKNALCVGATYCPLPGVPLEQVASYSGFGPTDDGRIKPDLVALGGDTDAEIPVLGAASATTYDLQARGTSLAAPVVSGSITLLAQLQENLYSAQQPLRASTWKALLCHTAVDMDCPGPDYKTGWGRVDAGAAGAVIKNNADRRKITEIYVPNGGTASLHMVAIGGAAKVTIAWTDPAGPAQPRAVDPVGTAAPYKVLVNDINLSLAASGGAVYHPWKLDPANPSGPATAAVIPRSSSQVPGRNFRDNVEQVSIASATAGAPYELRLQPAGPLTGGGQWVSVILTGFTQPPGAQECTISAASVVPYYNNAVTCSVWFASFPGHTYKIQCFQNYTWVDVPIPEIHATSTTTAAPPFVILWNPKDPPPSLRVMQTTSNPFNPPP